MAQKNLIFQEYIMIFTGLLLPILECIFFKKGEFENVNILLCECMKYVHDLCC